MFSKRLSKQQLQRINWPQIFLPKSIALAVAIGLLMGWAVPGAIALPFLPSESPEEDEPEEDEPEEVEPIEVEPIEVEPPPLEPIEDEYSFETFAQWCAARNSLPSQTQLTIDILLQKAQTSDCALADETLSDATELMLFRRQISDIRPLAGLTNLSQLWLDTNEISDISPLANLTNLKQLWLENNKIADVTPLSGLNGLTQLSLENNAISDVRPLSGLNNLTLLNLSTNNVSEIEALSALTSLTYLNLQGNPIVPREEEDDEPCPIEPESVCKY
ncbi:MAG: hypothetical protein SWY16_03075 [Cyanobacteriota bacterium]|nr:hypothetical protein [Cyanobacteriota bacterium]